MIWQLENAFTGLSAGGVHLAKFEDTLTLGDALVAFGTLALAGVTFWLALQTRREVKLSTSSIELARQGIEAQDMPFVICVPNPDQTDANGLSNIETRMWWDAFVDGYRLQMRLWNIGKGPAIVRDVRLLLGDDSDILWQRNVDLGELVIGPAEVHDIDVPSSGNQPPAEQMGEMHIYYAHSSGSEYMTSSSCPVGPGGVRCANFERKASDGMGRSVLLDPPAPEGTI
jgi:hypothetical protein